MIVPKPRQAAHGRSVRISPRNDRCTWATSPGAAAGLAGAPAACPGAAPSPWQVVQTHGGVDLELAGDPERRLGELDLEPDQRVLARGARAGAGPRPLPAGPPAVPPKNASMMSVNEKPGALAEAADAAERVAAAVVRPRASAGRERTS